MVKGLLLLGCYSLIDNVGKKVFFLSTSFVLFQWEVVVEWDKGGKYTEQTKYMYRYNT